MRKFSSYGPKDTGYLASCILNLVTGYKMQDSGFIASRILLFVTHAAKPPSVSTVTPCLQDRCQKTSQ